MFPITPYTNITMVKEWTGLRALLCSIEKVWVVSSKGWPFLSCQRCENSSTTGHRKRAGGTVAGCLCNGTHAKAVEKRYKKKNYNKEDHFNEKAQMRHIRYNLIFHKK